MDPVQRLLDELADLDLCLCGKSVCDGRKRVREIFDDYAHSLAEKIRQEHSDAWDRGNQDWDVDDAANLIDPKWSAYRA